MKCSTCVYYTEVNHEEARKCKCFCELGKDKVEIDENKLACYDYINAEYARFEMFGE